LHRFHPFNARRNALPMVHSRALLAPKLSPKDLSGTPIENRTQPCAPKTFLIRRGPIVLSAPRGHPCSTYGSMWVRRTQNVSNMASGECGCFLRYLHHRQPLVKPSNGFDSSPSGGREPSRRDGGMAWRESVTANSPATVVKYVCAPLRQVNLRRGVGLYGTRTQSARHALAKRRKM
jgi:hypothetical protein